MTSAASRDGHATYAGVIVRWTGWDDETDAGHRRRFGGVFYQRVGERFSSNAVLIRINKRPWHDGVFNEGLNGFLLHISKQIDDHLPTALHHPKDGRSFFLYGPTATFALESASTTLSALAFAHLWCSFMASHHRVVIAL